MPTMFCTSCGAPLGAAASFCGSCGVRVGGGAPVAASQPQGSPVAPVAPPGSQNPPTATATAAAPRARTWALLADAGSWKRWSGEECKGDLGRVGGKVKRKDSASTLTLGDFDDSRTGKESPERTFEVIEVLPGTRLVLRHKTFLNETIEQWELADAPGGTALAIWVTESGPLKGVKGFFNGMSYGGKLNKLASEAAKG